MVFSKNAVKVGINRCNRVAFIQIKIATFVWIFMRYGQYVPAMKEKLENILEIKGVKPTSNRILVVRAMLAAARPVSVTELETMLAPMDKSSIFRVLSLFVGHHIVHVIEDGSGTVKYEVCGSERCTVSDMHTHFYCEKCHRTYCFKAIQIPEIELPEGFSMSSVNYVVKGVCPECAARE